MAEPRPSPREQQVLAALSGHGATRLSFQGLRRLLGLHPQALTRTLRRLQEAGQVEEGPGGYALATRPETLPPLPVRQALPLLSMRLPGPELHRRVASALAGRWFRGLGWIGRSDVADAVVLAWLAEPSGIVVRLIADADHLHVEAPEEVADLPEVQAALRTLLPALGEALGAAAAPLLLPAVASPRPA